MQHTTRAIALGVLSAMACAPAAAHGANATSEISTTQGFRKALSADNAFEHLRAFQAHSDLNGGNRTGGSPGFDASRDHVVRQARAAGLEVSFHSFRFLYNADRTPPELRSAGASFVDGVDYSSMTFSESVPETTARLWAVELAVPAVAGAPDSSNTSGCQASDFAGMPAGVVALVMRGTCSFAAKSANAKAAGAVATIVMNEGNTSGRRGVINGTLGAPNQGAALGASYDAGVVLARGVADGDTGRTVTVKIDRVQETRTTENVIAETPGGDPDHVVVVGAHLDSVPRGAGINDNGTGSAGILEIAETLRQRDLGTRNKLRFMWFSAEEFGLLGSNIYVNSLSEDELGRIDAMLNFDMIGSPNYVRFVYDGDNSGFPVGPGAAAGPEGSGELERIFRDYFVGVGLTSGETPFSGRSDYGRFIARDIPSGGLFTGAEGVKTLGQQRVYGGEAGVAYDRCYHLRCDDLSNVNRRGYEEMLDAAGHATLTLARRDFEADPLRNPTTDVSGSDGLTPSGGGLHEDHDHEDEEA